MPNTLKTIPEANFYFSDAQFFMLNGITGCIFEHGEFGSGCMLGIC
jgi:hypothetical protein